MDNHQKKNRRPTIEMTAPNMPQPFWDDPTMILPNWKEYKTEFRTYQCLKIHHFRQHLSLRKLDPPIKSENDMLAAIKLHYPDEVKNMELWSQLGKEGRRQFQTIADSERYQKWSTDQMWEECDKLFDRPENEMVAFFDLLRRHKHADEDMQAYLTELKIIVNKCGFEGKSEKLLVNMLVFGCDDKQIQEHIYSTVQKPTMETVFPIMQQMEKARLEVRQ
ncbi:MAG: hypothetical protein GY915_00155, partial [bacterium]|nr:hypothetical protein [bacterium]